MTRQNPWLGPVSEALEAARVEVWRRMKAHGLPLSVEVERLLVTANDDRTGWSSSWKVVAGNGLNAPGVEGVIRDDSVPGCRIGMREQLLPLARELATTHLAEAKEMGLLPDGTGEDAVLARYCVPLAWTYLTELENLLQPDAELAARLASELEAFVNADTQPRVWQVTLSGLTPAEPLEHDGVELRPLSDEERGAFIAQQLPEMDKGSLRRSDVIIPRRLGASVPSTLLVTRTERPRDQYPESEHMLERVLLALFIEGYEICGGMAVSFDLPRWASMGYFMDRTEITAEKHVTDRDIDEETFRKAVDLAKAMPDFSEQELSRKSIVLHRAFLGGAAASSSAGFLDFAIALEGALLDGNDRGGLSYRFSLYGALFLESELPAPETFERLKKLYRVRSNLVHGAVVTAVNRESASKDAAELAYRIIEKSVLSGWPNAGVLKSRALS